MDLILNPTQQQNVEHNERGQMEVNFVVALKFHPELEVASDTTNILDTANLFDTTRQSENVKSHVPTEINVLHIDSIALTNFVTTIKCGQ
jgi:hypothetical protein